MRVASGLYLNALNQAISVDGGVIGALSTYYPITNAWDRRADLRARWASSATGGPAPYNLGLEQGIILDLNVLFGGSCEFLSAWTVQGGIGTITLNSTTKLEGSNSIQLSHTAPSVAVSRVFKVRAGQTLHFSGGIRCTVGGSAGVPRGITLVLRNMVTGKVFNVIGSGSSLWIAAGTMSYNAGYVLQSASDAWNEVLATAPLVIPMESFAACGVDAVDCRFEMHVWSTASTTVTGVFDALYIYPPIDTAALVGYNGTAENLAAWLRTPGGLGAAVKLFDLGPAGERVVFKHTLPAVDSRYHVIEIPFNSADTQVEPLREIGEMILAQTVLLAAAPLYPVRFDYRMPSYKASGPTTQVYTTPLIESGRPPRRVVIQFEVATFAEATQVRDEFYLRSGCGRDPVLFLPTEAEDTILYGSVPTEVSIAQNTFGVYSIDIELNELPIF